MGRRVRDVREQRSGHQGIPLAMRWSSAVAQATDDVVDEEALDVLDRASSPRMASQATTGPAVTTWPGTRGDEARTGERFGAQRR